jgi:hypothetical protein
LELLPLLILNKMILETLSDVFGVGLPLQPWNQGIFQLFNNARKQLRALLEGVVNDGLVLRNADVFHFLDGVSLLRLRSTWLHLYS